MSWKATIEDLVASIFALCFGFAVFLLMILAVFGIPIAIAIFIVLVGLKLVGLI